MSARTARLSYSQEGWASGAKLSARLADDCRPTAQQELLLRAALVAGPDANEAWRRWSVGADWDRLDSSSLHVLPKVYWNRAIDVEAFCEALGLDRVGIVGLSGGGPYALACDHEMTESIVAIALLGGPAPAIGDDACRVPCRGSCAPFHPRFPWCGADSSVNGPFALRVT